MNLVEALDNPLWLSHKIGDQYTMLNRDGKSAGVWKIAYYPLHGTYKNGVWEDFEEPRALVEQPLKEGNDFREVPLRYLQRL